jgi:hypothetical protein
MHTMMAFPGEVLREYNPGERPVPYMPEFLDCRNGKVWPNDRPGLRVSLDEQQLTFIEAMTEGVPGVTHRRPDSVPHGDRVIFEKLRRAGPGKWGRQRCGLARGDCHQQTDIGVSRHGFSAPF